MKPLPSPDLEIPGVLALGQAATTLAHDLRQIFQGLLDQLDEAPEPWQSRVRTLVTAGEAMTADMLALAGLGPGAATSWPRAHAAQWLGHWCSSSSLDLEDLRTVQLPELRAISNLVANARQAAGRGGCIKVRYLEDSHGRHWIVDNDIRNPRTKGHGLGLSLVNEFCKQAGGQFTLELESESCRAVITLPPRPPHPAESLP
ncbi:MAG: ATP-binding protein [Candidatus Sericytochromatia bacterium]|nr:ATP-binding protein [Candidatus Sericytochromatia bacterium]